MKARKEAAQTQCLPQASGFDRVWDGSVEGIESVRDQGVMCSDAVCCIPCVRRQAFVRSAASISCLERFDPPKPVIVQRPPLELIVRRVVDDCSAHEYTDCARRAAWLGLDRLFHGRRLGQCARDGHCKAQARGLAPSYEGRQATSTAGTRRRRRERERTRPQPGARRRRQPRLPNLDADATGRARARARPRPRVQCHRVRDRGARVGRSSAGRDAREEAPHALPLPLALKAAPQGRLAAALAPAALVHAAPSLAAA